MAFLLAVMCARSRLASAARAGMPGVGAPRMTVPRFSVVTVSTVSEAQKRYQAQAIGGIVLDVHTGEVMALAGLPDYDPNRREESVGLVAAQRQEQDWALLAGFGEDTATALAALDAQLRRAVALAREWLGGEEPDQSLRELEIIRGRLAEGGDLIREALLEPDPNRIYWFTLQSRTGVLSLRAAPLEVDDRGPRQRQCVPAAISQRQAPQQDRAGAADRRTPQHQDRSVSAVRRPDQAHP